MGLLAVAALVALVRWPSVGPSMFPLVAIHAGLLVGFTILSLLLVRFEGARAVSWVRPVATVAVVFTLYTTLGKLGLAAMPYSLDGALSRLDTRLFGVDPSLWIQRYQTFGWVEFYSFVYGAFIPYIHLSIALNSLGRPPLERDRFLTSWVLLYSLSYLGYLFLPARGPAAFHSVDYKVALTGGFCHRLVDGCVEASGGLQGAFPSLHVGGALFLCLYDRQRDLLRSLTYAPLVLLIYGATVFLRYHYVVDLIAGTALALACIPLGERVFARWSERRMAAGVPVLPGGDEDVLQAFPGTRALDAADLLPPN